MSTRTPEPPESSDRRITWSVYVLTGVGFCLAGGVLAPWLRLPGGGVWFLPVLLMGGGAGFLVNRLRPPYDLATGRWRAFYDFLLRQMPPPD